MNAVMAKRAGGRKIDILHWIGRFFLLVFALLTVIPVFWAFTLSVKSNTEIFNAPFSLPQHWMWSNYASALKIMKLPILVRNTMIDVVVSVSVGMLLTVFSSFAISRMRFGRGRLQNFFYMLFIAGVIVPVFVILFPVYIINYKIGALGTLWAMILPHIAWSAPMNTLLMVSTFKSIPESLEEAAIIDGSSLMRVIFGIDMPIMIPTLATVLIISFLGVWNDFSLAVVMLNSTENRTVALAVSFFKGLYSVDYAQMTAAIMILVAPQIFVFSFFQKYIIDGLTIGAVKG